METEKAEKEIKSLLDSGLSFDYKIDMNIINKKMFCIEQEGFSMKDIISKLKEGEKILFYLNDGYRSDWDNKKGYSPRYQIKDREGSIYWKNDTYGECVRIDSDMGSIREWCLELSKIYNITNSNRICWRYRTNINMKKIIEEIDFLWKGDRSMLITMWLCILLALAVLTELGFNIYFTFFN